jgi:hypothetical protein
MVDWTKLMLRTGKCSSIYLILCFLSSNAIVVHRIAVTALAGFVELENAKMKEEKGKSYIPGDCGLSNWLPSDSVKARDLQTKEIKNGRLAMMALLGFVVQEALYGKPVVEQTPFFFHPSF